MPCNSDYLEATWEERKFSQIACMIEELRDGKPIDSHHWSGYHPSVYSNSKTHRDALVSELCSLCQKANITKCSLEVQIWWRDHQIADNKRIQSEIESEKTEQAKKAALAKLTDYERGLLGI